MISLVKIIKRITKKSKKRGKKMKKIIVLMLMLSLSNSQAQIKNRIISKAALPVIMKNWENVADTTTIDFSLFSGFTNSDSMCFIISIDTSRCSGYMPAVRCRYKAVFGNDTLQNGAGTITDSVLFTEKANFYSEKLEYPIYNFIFDYSNVDTSRINNKINVDLKTMYYIK